MFSYGIKQNLNFGTALLCYGWIVFFHESCYLGDFLFALIADWLQSYGKSTSIIIFLIDFCDTCDSAITAAVLDLFVFHSSEM